MITDAASVAAGIAPTDEIRFVEHHRPQLEAGAYRIDITQTVDASTQPPFRATKTIAVAGARHALAPELVAAVFPPANSRGDHWHTFAHVVLSRATLPWERSACDDIADKNLRPPWLALLLFDQDEWSAATRTVVPLRELRAASPAIWPGLPAEPGEHDDDPVVTIDVPWSLLAGQLPRGLEDFRLRSHVRRVVPATLRTRIRHWPAGAGAVVDCLQQKWSDGALAELMAADGVRLGAADAVHWPLEHSDGPNWQFTDPVAGAYTVSRGDGAAGPWLHVSGGPVPATGALGPQQRHDFVAVEMSLAPWMPALNDDTLPPALQTLVSACGHALVEPRIETETPGVQWRLVDRSSGTHLLLRAADGALEIHGYASAATELAVVVGNRLPTPGRRCVAHLVSLEQRYRLAGTAGADCAWADVPAAADARVRLVSLKSWDFFCVAGAGSFQGLALALNDGATQSPGFGLAASADDDIAARLASGCVPLRHHMRHGDRTVSWYHGPLRPSAPAGALPDGLLPASCADALLRFDHAQGLFDVSHAAAWEIGRMAMLADTALALQLYSWKRHHAHALAATRQRIDLGFELPAHAALPDAAGLPPELVRWFADLGLLRHVPFRYLVPDERLLPPESLRFFSVDEHWLACLRDGAFSVGRVLRGDATRDRHHKSALPAAPVLSGFLLRSELVSSHADVGITGYGVAPPAHDEAVEASHPDPAHYPQLPCLRREALAPSVLLVLFAGELRMLDLHRAPETLHFGLDLPQADDAGHPQRDPAGLSKSLRSADGSPTEIVIGPAEPGALAIDARRVVDLARLARAMAGRLGDTAPQIHAAANAAPPSAGAALHPAAFALQMVAGVELVRFIRKLETAPPGSP